MVKVIQLPHHLKKDGTCPIVIRITEGGKRKYIKTGFSVEPKYFKDGLVVRHPEAMLINQAIESKRTQVSSPVSESLLSLLLKRQTLHESRDQAAIFEKLGHLIKHVKKVGDTKRVTEDWINRYISSRKGMKASTIKKELARLGNITGSELFKKAQKELKAENPHREKLTLEEIKLLEQTPITGLNDVARDMFLFAYYAHGMRFENVATFKPKGSSIIYRMNKGKKVREIELHPKLKTLINKYKGNKPYLFPLVKETEITNWNKKEVIGNANALVNIRLKRVAILCGIEKHLHFHMSRHSFASLSLERGASYATLKDALGHTKYQTTEIYLNSLSDKKVNDEVNGLYD